jgi:hypothetical protein
MADALASSLVQSFEEGGNVRAVKLHLDKLEAAAVRNPARVATCASDALAARTDADWLPFETCQIQELLLLLKDRMAQSPRDEAVTVPSLLRVLLCSDRTGPPAIKACIQVRLEPFISSILGTPTA